LIDKRAKNKEQRQSDLNRFTCLLVNSSTC